MLPIFVTFKCQFSRIKRSTLCQETQKASCEHQSHSHRRDKKKTIWLGLVLPTGHTWECACRGLLVAAQRRERKGRGPRTGCCAEDCCSAGPVAQVRAALCGAGGGRRSPPGVIAGAFRACDAAEAAAAADACVRGSSARYQMRLDTRARSLARAHAAVESIAAPVAQRLLRLLCCRIESTQQLAWMRDAIDLGAAPHLPGAARTPALLATPPTPCWLAFSNSRKLAWQINCIIRLRHGNRQLRPSSQGPNKAKQAQHQKGFTRRLLFGLELYDTCINKCEVRSNKLSF